MDNLVKNLGGGDSFKTQTVTQRIKFTGSYYLASFTFDQLKEVKGVVQISRANNGLRFCSYQVIKRNIGYEMQLFASISGNTVSFVLEEQAEATTEADWTVTAIGS